MSACNSEIKETKANLWGKKIANHQIYTSIKYGHLEYLPSRQLKAKERKKKIYLLHVFGWLNSCSWVATVTFLRTPDSSDPVSGFRQKTGRASGGQKLSAPQINTKEASQHTLLPHFFTVSQPELHFIASLQAQTHTPTWFREDRDRHLPAGSPVPTSHWLWDPQWSCPLAGG